MCESRSLAEIEAVPTELEVEDPMPMMAQPGQTDAAVLLARPNPLIDEAMDRMPIAFAVVGCCMRLASVDSTEKLAEGLDCFVAFEAFDDWDRPGLGGGGPCNWE